ncbi:uncharacterized protein LODBEIA_P46350 [Lodderomyces beijingensis]|uniref:DDHD domain-containing protein n=1 Tax=Lodderomyces beijingensis TaxID=1775926 RepID=A0ABP0ZTX1_9ASCO
MMYLTRTLTCLVDQASLLRSTSLSLTLTRLNSTKSPPPPPPPLPPTQQEAPKPNIRWFYASDVPISKPEWFYYEKTKDPESFIPFSEYDSKNLERAFLKDATSPVEVNEDKLFEVNVEKFQLMPVYWEGPVYEVRRGIWFNKSGVPLPNKVTMEIEDGYKLVKPYFFEQGVSEKKSKANKAKIAEFNDLQKKRKKNDLHHETQSQLDVSKQKDVHKLSNGQLVLYFNQNQAVLFPANYDSDFQIDIIRFFGPNPVSLLGVEHIQRGYSEELKKTIFDKLPSIPLPSIADTFQKEFSSVLSSKSDDVKSKITTPQTSAEENDIDDKNMQHYLEADYDKETSKTKSNREIDHLILCVHGIGQVLGNTYESVNFTHSINVLRNTMKKVFEENKDYQKLAYDEGSEDKDNNRIQVLPISWRHRVEFYPRRTEQQNADNRLPTLSQINVDGIKALRDVVGDVVLDVLLYYQPRYLHQIFESVTSEVNRVYKEYKKRNPRFNGKVHILGHSLGSAIAFDILSEQTGTIQGTSNISENHVQFPVDNLFLLGSPVGLFKLLEGKNIEARTQVTNKIEPSKNTEIASPKCNNLYNVYHPCDPVAYRVEPLVSPEFGHFKAVPVQFAVKGLDSQIQELASVGDEISEKILSAARWLNIAKKEVKKLDAKTIEERAKKENALSDLITSIAMSEQEESVTDGSESSSHRKLTKKELVTLTALNKTGRIDYSLPMGVLDFSLVSAISAHVSYFEDENTAGFIMKQVLSKSQSVKKTVALY